LVGEEGLFLLAWVIVLALAETSFGSRARDGASDRRLFTNVSFTVIVLVAGTIFPVTRLVVSGAAQSLNMGLLRSVQWPWLALFAAALLTQTFASYWAHRITHGTPLLWRLHRIHHADNEVDLSTSFRNHPLELMITLPVSAAVVLILGTSQSVVVATQTLLAGVTLWQHADIAIPPRIDRALAWIVVTPRLHRLHHNPARTTHDSNYGELLTLWDRLFGTFDKAEGRQPVGLEGQVAHPDRLLQQIWSPVYGS
jgi:sterol desaturase/sphingolipid hydroxylase (fatty acid hydroxylase superfamily)